jgi:hypothetical protein
MKGKIKAHHLILAFMLALFLSFMFFSGCGEKTKTVTEKVYVHDTLTVTDTMYLEVVRVDSPYATLSNITQGETVQLTVKATKADFVGNLTFYWFADGGQLDQTEGDTVSWKAPDDAGVSKITVHATDGEYIGIGVGLIGVGMYAPTRTPYFVGGPTCDCHGTLLADWEDTGHAVAWATLQASGHALPSCNPCHTVQDTIPGNSGFNDAPIVKFENVQCEDCHGPASDHLATLSPEDIIISYDVMVCGICHNGTHHPYLAEWEASLHGHALENHGASVASCQGCHEGVAGAVRLSGDLGTFYGSGSIARPDTTLQPINCITCHNPHSDENPGQVRTVADVHLVEANGANPIVTDGGVGKLCMQCHHARHSAEEQLAEGDDHFGPHPSTQADMLAGKSGYEGVASAGYDWGRAIHLYVENSCKTCHMNEQEFSQFGAAIVNHIFEPTVEACAYCHGTISSFSDIPAAADYDGDGTVEGLQVEVEGLLDSLTHALVLSGLDTTGGIANALGNDSISTYVQRQAGYNLVFVEDDGSMGVHNPRYAVRLLQQSYQFLTGSMPKNAAILRGDEKPVAW